MRNPEIDPFAAEEIRDQVDKVIRGLGNPEPPLNLRDVLELLKLDRQYYSSADAGHLRELVSKVKIGAKQLALRPTLIFDVVRKSGLKALWIPDRKRILIDVSIPDLKKRHAEAHEIAHSLIPHHSLFLFGDDGETLSQSCHEKLEAEANFGASQLLFLSARFAAEARDCPHDLATVLSLSKSFGNTITMTFWKMVEEAPDAVPTFGMISGHPRRPDAEFNPQTPCRYFVESPEFRRKFSEVSVAEAYAVVQGYASAADRGSLGEGEAVLVDQRGQRHAFRMETFFNRYDALTLGTYLRPLPVQVAAL